MHQNVGVLVVTPTNQTNYIYFLFFKLLPVCHY